MYPNVCKDAKRASTDHDRVSIVNVLLVLGSERLYVEMTKLLNTNKTVTVVRVPKSDGVSLSL